MTRFTRLALACLLAFASFLIGSALVRPYAPNAEGGELVEKLEYFEATRDTFNAVVFGSSRVLRGLDTQAVDRAMTPAGTPTRTYNLGVAGTWAFEQDYLLHRILAQRPKHLRWIFYGGRPVGSEAHVGHGFDVEPDPRSARGVQWHTPRQTELVLGATRRMAAPLLERLGLASLHLELFARNRTAFGRGPDAWGRRFESDLERGIRESKLMIMHRTMGFMPLEDFSDLEPLGVLRERPAGFERRVAGITELNAAPLDLDAIHTRVYLEQQAAARELGIELIYFTAPGLEGTPERLRLHEAGVIETLFHFNDPERYPELFKAKHRFDRGHLNNAGARHWSKRFAERWLQHLAETESD